MTDNVREALAERIFLGLALDDWGVANDEEREDFLYAADAILSRFVVTPKGQAPDGVAALIARVKDRPTITRMSHADQIEAIEALRDALERASQPVTEEQVEAMCEVMHDAYERAAAYEGWETQERSRKPWAEVPEANQRTMRVAVRAVLEAAREAGR